MGDYYDWLNSFVTPLVQVLERELRKGFGYDLKMAEAASRHSDTMRRYSTDYSYHAPKEFWGVACAELVSDPCYAVNENWAIRQAMEKIAFGFLNSSDGHREMLERFSVIGVGLAISQFGNGWVKIYTTIRLRY